MAFTVQIINIENNVNNILLTDDLTIEILKVRYNWILNASIRNAVLGLDDYGLVWYMGEWICGEWEDGTWYSGIWHDGIWKNGRWYSYLLDKGMILTKQFVVIEEDKMYSQFLNGKWYNGEWYNGTFGNDNNISGMTSTQVTNSLVPCPYWYNGNFHNGLFKNAVWKKGIFFNGSMVNSYWVDGKFYNGSFDNFEWWTGGFYGGDFVEGWWKSGVFNQLNTNVLARFGTLTGSTSCDKTLSTWESGLFENGQFMSGYNVDDSGNTIASVCHNVTHWKDGTFNNGLWYGGHFEKGYFNYGTWYGGIFNTNTGSTHTSETIWKNGIWNDGLWLNGIFKAGMFFSGMWINGIFENGFLVSQYQGTFSSDLKTNVVPQLLPPPPPPPTYTIPTVTLVSIGTPDWDSCPVTGDVVHDGGLATVRGICYAKTSTPTKSNLVIYDNSTGEGIYTDSMVQLDEQMNYYVRAFATNSIGTSYSSLPATLVHTVSSPAPKAETISSVPVNNTVTLQGKVKSQGTSVLTQYGFFYSINPNLGGTYVEVGTSGTPPFTYHSSPPPITGLLWNQKYYFLAFATNAYGTGFGLLQDFTTPSGPPIVETTPVSNITLTTADSGGNVTSDGGTEVTARGVCYSSTSSSPTIIGTHTSDGTGMGSFISHMIGLTNGTTYYVRAYATNSAGTSYGTSDVFTCNVGLPVLTTTTITNITSTAATSGGNVTSNGGTTVTARGVCWNTSSNPTTSNNKTTNGTGNGVFVSNITGLVPGVTYYVRAYATNSVGTSYGNQLNFTSLITTPTVTTTAITNITSTTATSGGNVTNDGGSSLTARGNCWKTSPSPTISNNHTTNGIGTGSFVGNLTGLVSNTTYYVRAYGTNLAGTGYGSEVTFSTTSVPVVTTTTASSITTTTSTLGGNVTSDGGSSVTERGVCWSISSNPTTSGTHGSSGTGTGVYTVNATGLIQGETYHYRAYAINSNGTGYGTEKTMTTLNIPDVITSSISNITNTGATSGGYILSDGGTAVTAKGVCWSTSSNPTTSGSHTTNGTGTGTYTSSITGLLYGHLYYVRAYATNSVGTSYGNQLTFTTLTVPTVTTGSVITSGNDWDVYGNNVSSDGGYTCSQKGICWATHTNPLISDFHSTDGSGLGTYDSYGSGLYGTVYYMRAYAKNGVGVGYGNEHEIDTWIHP